MKFCQGKNCTAINDMEHSPECLFEHFMSYTDYCSQPDTVRTMLQHAYMDGYIAGAQLAAQGQRLEIR